MYFSCFLTSISMISLFCSFVKILNRLLGQIQKTKRGKRLVRSQLEQVSRIDNYPVFQNSLSPLGFYNEYNCQAESVFVIAAGNAGDIGYSELEFWAADDCYFYEHSNDIHQKYLYYYFLLNQKTIAEQTRRTSIPRLSRDILDNLVLQLPEVAEQEAIADTLTVFDTHIANLTELIEKKKAVREGALEDLISGKTRLSGFTGKWETVNFESVIIPKARIGWQGLKSDEYLRKGFCYLIGGTDFYNGTVSLDNIWFVSEERYAMDANIQVEENDVLVTKDGTIGKIALVPHLEKPATLNSGVFVFRTKNGLTRQFLYRVLISSIFRGFIDTLAAGSTIKHLYQKDLKNFSFSIPTDEAEQEAIATVLNTMDYEILSLKEERDKMIKIREGAMDDLLTGKVRLTD